MTEASFNAITTEALRAAASKDPGVKLAAFSVLASMVEKNKIPATFNFSTITTAAITALGLGDVTGNAQDINNLKCMRINALTLLCALLSNDKIEKQDATTRAAIATAATEVIGKYDAKVVAPAHVVRQLLNATDVKK